MLEQFAQKSCRFSIPGAIQSQVGWVQRQPNLVLISEVGNDGRVKGIRTRLSLRSLLTQVIHFMIKYDLWWVCLISASESYPQCISGVFCIADSPQCCFFSRHTSGWNLHQDDSLQVQCFQVFLSLSHINAAACTLTTDFRNEFADQRCKILSYCEWNTEIKKAPIICRFWLLKFYSKNKNNCNPEIQKHINIIEPGQVHWHFA